MEKVEAKIAGASSNPVWAEEAAKCILCGGCNWVCPTCYCFNIEDVTSGDKTQRVRYWDSCQLGGFTQMVAMNSRATQAERLRQRIYQKFSYNPDKYGGEIGCTGVEGALMFARLGLIQLIFSGGHRFYLIALVAQRRLRNRNRERSHIIASTPKNGDMLIPGLPSLGVITVGDLPVGSILVTATSLTS